MVDFNKWQEAQKDNDLHRENVRLQQEVVKRDALIDLLGRELDKKPKSDSEKTVYVVNGVNEDMLKLVRYQGELKRRLKEMSNLKAQLT